jgi:hypothetical protein
MELRRENKFIKPNELKEEAARRAARYFTVYYSGTTGTQPEAIIDKFKTELNAAGRQADAAKINKDNFTDYLADQNDPQAKKTMSDLLEVLRTYSGKRT